MPIKSYFEGKKFRPYFEEKKLHKKGIYSVVSQNIKKRFSILVLELKPSKGGDFLNSKKI